MSHDNDLIEFFGQDTPMPEMRLRSLQRENDALRSALRNALEYFELVLRGIPLPLTFRGQLNTYRTALTSPAKPHTETK